MSDAIEQLVDSAKRLVAERNYGEAVRAARRVLLSRPQLGEVRILLGMSLLALKRHDEARAEMLAILRTDDQNATAHRLLAEAYLRGGQTDNAKESLRHALELSPDDTEAKELMVEVEEERAPPTLDRWFDPEAVATVQSDPPDFFNDTTVLSQSDDLGDIEDEALLDVITEVPKASYRSPPVPTFPGRSTLPSSPPPAPVSHPTLRGRPDSVPVPSADAFGADQTAAHTPHAKKNPSAPGRQFPLVDESDDDQVTFALDPDPDDFEGASTHALDPDELPPYAPIGTFGTVNSEPRRQTESLVVPSPLPGPGPSPRVPPSSEPHHHPPASGYPLGAPSLSPPGGYPSGYSSAPPPSPLPPLSSLPPLAGPSQAPPPPPRANIPPTAAMPEFRAPIGVGPVLPGAPPPSSLPPGAFAGGPLPPEDDPLDDAPTGFVQTPESREKASLPPAETEKRGAVRAPARTPRVSKKTGRSKVLLWLGMVFAALLLTAAVAGAVYWWVDRGEAQELEAAVDLASRDGRKATVESALILARARGEGAETAALRARLLATLTLDYGTGQEAEALEALTTADGEGLSANSRVAQAYLALAAADVGRAEEVLSGAENTEPEVARARALIQMTRGAASPAEGLARSAYESFTEPAPRHAALYAIASAQNGNVEEARQVLDSVEEGVGFPSIRAARARITLNSGADPSGATAEARVVLEELASVASPDDQAWANLVLARVLTPRADVRRHLTEARSSLVGRDPYFGLDLVEAVTDYGAGEEALEVFGELPEIVADPARRAFALAELRLLLGDMQEVEAALAQAPMTPQRSYLEGRILEARGDLRGAKHAYEQVTGGSSQSARAQLRLGAVALAANELEEALGFFTQAFERTPSDTELVPLYVTALLQADRAQDAQRVVRDALERQPESPELLIARANTELASGEHSAAVASLTAASTLVPDSTSVLSELADALQRAGQLSDAEGAWDRVIELSPQNPRAHAAVAELKARSGDLEAARASLAIAQEHGSNLPSYRRADALVKVAEGAGQPAVGLLAALVSEHPSDLSLRVALARAQFQAEVEGSRRSFQAVLAIDANNPEALLGVAEAELRWGSVATAQRYIDRLASASTDSLGAPFAARVLAMRGVQAFENSRFDEATRLAAEAIALDEDCSDAYFLRALVEAETGGDSVASLRRASQASGPLPEALGMLVLQTRVRAERCEPAARYLSAAPNGADASEVRRASAHCR